MRPRLRPLNCTNSSPSIDRTLPSIMMCLVVRCDHLSRVTSLTRFPSQSASAKAVRRLDRTGLGDVPGHGLSVSGDFATATNLRIMDYGSDGVGGGAGVNGSGDYMRIENVHMEADPASSISLGWVVNSNWGFFSKIYVDGCLGGVGYAHELKNVTTFNALSDLIARGSNVAIAYGQEGGRRRAITWRRVIVSEACDTAITVGEGGSGNVFNGVLHNGDNSVGNRNKDAIRFSGTGNNRNVVYAAASYGDVLIPSTSTAAKTWLRWLHLTMRVMSSSSIAATRTWCASRILVTARQYWMRFRTTAEMGGEALMLTWSAPN